MLLLLTVTDLHACRFHSKLEINPSRALFANAASSAVSALLLYQVPGACYAEAVFTLWCLRVSPRLDLPISEASG